MNLNDLSPADQRKRIEEILGMTKTPKVGQIVGVLDADLQTLCRLALRALPPQVEWEDTPDISKAGSSGWRLMAMPFKDQFTWATGRSSLTFASGFAPSLELAKAAAEDALGKLLGGSE